MLHLVGRESRGAGAEEHGSLAWSRQSIIGELRISKDVSL